MTTPPRQPLTVELLADLHAGALDEDVAAQLWARVHDDPHARSVLATLDATVADLSAAPPLRMPADVATRIDTALAGELASRRGAGRTGPAPVPDLAARRHRRGRIGLLASGVAAAAAAAVVGVVVLTGGDSGSDGPPVAEPGAPLQLTVQTIADGFGAAHSAQDFGPLADPGTRRDCLRVNGITGDPIGARQVVVDGRPGVAMVLTTGQLGRFRLVVVGASCGTGEPALIADRIVGP